MRHITSNAVVVSPDKNVTIAKKCSVFPVEFVVRGFVTRSTDTSLWTVYSKGVCNYCRNAIPNGLLKNQRLPANILTPTSKAADHDVPITPQQIVQRRLMTQDEYDEISTKALSLFKCGQVHIPESSRYWIAHCYVRDSRMALNLKMLTSVLYLTSVNSQEFLRLWFKEHCNPYEDEVLPDAPQELTTELAWLYTSTIP